MAVHSRPQDDAERQLSGASPTVKHQGPLWHGDQPVCLGVSAVVDDRGCVKTLLQASACKRAHALANFIAFIASAIPKRFISLLRLYASTCRLILVGTCLKAFIRKCVEPIQYFSVPKTCSTCALVFS